MDESNERKIIDVKKQYSGTIYQIKVLLLLLCRGKKVESHDDFYLRTEVKDAEKFDDALFYYKKTGETIYNVRFCQIKNSESETAELRYEDFVSNFDKAVANIKKYFICYRKIKMTAVNENVDDFILCTSYKVPIELKKNAKAKADEMIVLTEDKTNDELFGIISEQWKRYRISHISQELRESLLKTSNLDLMTEALTECILKSKKQNSQTVIIDLENFWLSIYEFAFQTENVIVEKTRNFTKSNVQKEFIFSENFLKDTALSKECQNFRKIFLKQFGAKLMNVFIQNKQFNADNSFTDVLEMNKNERKRARTEDSSCSTNMQINETEIKILAKRFSESIFNEKPLTEEIWDLNIISLTALKNFLKKILKIMHNGNVKFTGNFAQNENLTNDAKVFRETFLTSYAIMELESLTLKLMPSKNENITDDHNTGSWQQQNFNNNVDIEAEIKQFLEKFSIQTMPHHNELMYIIKEEIGEEFDLLDDKWVTNSLLEKVEQWFKAAEEVPLDKLAVTNYFDEIKKNVVVEMLETSFYIEMLKSHHLSFETTPDTWKTFLKPLTAECDRRHPSQLLFLSTKEPILTAIKVENALLFYDVFKKQKSFVMAPASMLLQMEHKANYIMNALISQNCYKLIIVVDDDETATLSLFNYFLKAVKKQIILITAKKTSEYDSIRKNYTFQEEEDLFQFDQLTQTSQDYLIKKLVMFQGKSVPLGKIISNAGSLIDSKTVMELSSSSRPLELCPVLEPYKEYDEKSYVERKIGLAVMNEVFYTKTFSDCLFMIEGENTEEIYKFLRQKNISENEISSVKWNSNSHFFIVDSKKAKTSFQHLCEKNSNLNIYWFLFDYDNLCWFHCTTSAFNKGAKDNPLSYVETHFQVEKEATRFLNKLKVVIITDLPGMGKSTILTNLCQRIPDDVLKWMVRIDLNQYTKQLMEIKEGQPNENDNYKDIGKYIIDKLNERIPANFKLITFAIRIFDEMFLQNKVLFIFDGFDEISPDYETLVLNIFERIHASSQNH